MASKPGILDYASENADFASVMSSINQQAADMANKYSDSALEAYSPENRVEDQTDQSSGGEAPSPGAETLDLISRGRRSRLNKIKRAYSEAELPNDPPMGIPNYEYPFESPGKFLPKETKISSYVSATSKYLDTAHFKESRDTGRAAEAALGSLGPGIKEMGTPPNFEKLRKPYSLSASGGRGLT